MGSWLAFAVASIAACSLIFSAAAQNIAHGYALGLVSSEFRALVLAAASAGASILGPCAWLAVIRGRGIGTRAIALLLALGCLVYAGVCSLGFVAGSRSEAVSERSAAIEAHADRRAVADAARSELANLATIKVPTKAVLDRRRELAAILVPKTGEQRTAPADKDAQASAVGFYLRAAGWKVDDAAVGVWLSLGMALYLEAAAALSLTVAAALRPTRPAAPPAADLPPPSAEPSKPQTAASEPATRRQDENDDDPQPPPRPKNKGGRPATVLPAQAVQRLRDAGGKATGTVRGVGKLLGTRSKTASHRLIHALASEGLVQLSTGPYGVRVALV